MAEYVAGRGTTGMSIAGLVTGIIGTLGAGGNLMGAAGATPYEARGACMHDVDDAKAMAEKDAEIARLRSEKYADGVREDAKQYGIELYKQVESELRVIEREQATKWGEQSVINAQISDSITALNGKADNTANLVAQITRTAVPKSAICNFGDGGCGCGNNI